MKTSKNSFRSSLLINVIFLFSAFLLAFGCVESAEEKEADDAATHDDVVWKGEIDSTFNGKGYATVKGNGRSVFALPDGKILVVGRRWADERKKQWERSDLLVWKYNANGTLDSGFGNDGVITRFAGWGGGGGYAVAVDGAGGIIIVGTSWKYQDESTVTPFMTIWRYDQNGDPDTSFGDNGMLRTRGHVESKGYGVALDSKDRIVVAGYGDEIWRMCLGKTGSWRRCPAATVWRFNGGGSRDMTFNGNGYALLPIGQHSTWGQALAIDANDKILIAGTITVEREERSRKNIYTDDIDMAVWRLNSDGSRDMTFNGQGYAVHDNAAGGEFDDYPKDIAIDAQGRILVTGASYAHFSNSSDREIILHMAIWRYNDDGSLDQDFGRSGVVTYGYDSPDSKYLGNSINLDAKGNILVTGLSNDDWDSANNSRSYINVWRFDANGALNNAFKHYYGSDNKFDSWHAIGSSVFDHEGRLLVATGHGYGKSETMTILRVK